MNIDFAELDAVLATVKFNEPIIIDRGFTARDLAQHRGFSEPTARRLLGKLVRDGLAKHIGFRPGVGGVKVYEMVSQQKSL